MKESGKNMSKMLIVYYSWSNGNTKKIAEELQKATGADLARIDTLSAYKNQSYDEVVRESEKDIAKGYKPELAPLYFHLKDYDTVAVGTPTWWYTMAPAMKTFLESQDFTGKKAAFFATHGGWPGHALKDMEKACKGASFGPELTIQFDSTGGSHQVTGQDKVEEWIRKVQGWK